MLSMLAHLYKEIKYLTVPYQVSASLSALMAQADRVGGNPVQAGPPPGRTPWRSECGNRLLLLSTTPRIQPLQVNDTQNVSLTVASE